MSIVDKLDNFLKEANTIKDVPEEFMNDPLYKAVITAKDKKSFDKALDTLKKIRGSGAVDALKHAMKQKKLKESGATTTANVAKNLAKGHVDVVGGECPKGQRYDPKKKVCVPIITEEWKIQIKGITHDWMDIDLFYDPTNKNRYKDKKEAEAYMNKAIKAGRGPKSIRVVDASTKSAKENRRLREASVVGGSYIGATTVNIIGSGQTRVWGVKRGLMPDLDRKEPVDVEMDDPTNTNIIGRKGLKFNKLTGAYTPSLWDED